MGDYDELKPCPFCGGTNLRRYAFRAALDVHYAVQCYCGARSEDQTQEDADKCWNLRVPYEQLEAENEALRKDAERYRWLRDNAEAADWEFIGYQEKETTDMHVDSFRLLGEARDD